jgi:hypothetical protein
MPSDFISWLVDELLTFQPNANEKIRHYESIYALFERKKRPDLTCAARLKLTDLLSEQEKWQSARKRSDSCRAVIGRPDWRSILTISSPSRG